MSRSKELTKNTLTITLGRISTQFVSFLLLPLYTALLTTEEYGTVDFVSTLVQLLMPVASLMIDQGVFRHLLGVELHEEKKKTISSAFFLLVITGITTVVIYAFISLLISNDYKIWLLLILIATSFSNFFLQVARGLKHTGDYTIGSFICSASTIVLNVICIASLKLGAVGMLMASFIGNFVCCIFLFFKLHIHNYISPASFNKELAKAELKYSIPLVPNQLSLWVMNSSDRFIVIFMLGIAANGVLAVSHKFPVVYATFFNVFLLAWHETGAIHYFDVDRDQFFTDMVKKILSIFSTLCMGVIVILPLVFSWFVNISFGEAYYNIPIYLVASLFNVVIGLLGVVYVATKKTGEIAKTTLLAAIINIIVNIGLIKIIGLYAASISTFVGYFITMIYRVIDTKKYLKIKYNVKQILGISVSIIICCFIYYMNNKIISLVFFPIFVFFAYFLNKSTVDEVFGMIEHREGILKKKIMAIRIGLVVLIIAVSGFIVYKKISECSKEIEAAYKGEIVRIESKRIIYFSDFDSEDFTCTGLTYDSINNTYWLGNYGTLSVNNRAKPHIVEIDREFTHIIKDIPLDNILDSSVNLQGIAYDNKADCLWLALGDTIVQISKEGDVLKTINMGIYVYNKSNGIAYNRDDDTLWVLCASQFLLHYSKDGTVLEEFPFNYADQDHICIEEGSLYATVGADYEGGNNYVYKISLQTGNIESLYQVHGANALEGICFVGGEMFIANDGLYHNDLVGHSYISVYDAKVFNEESNQRE